MAGLLGGDLANHSMGESGSFTFNQDKQEGTSHWYLSRKDIEENSPSRRDGIDLKKETYLRKSYCTFLQDLGMRLKVPQVTIATAIIFCHRFFLHQSHAKNDRRTVATVCMFLAGKVEETPRPLKDVILVSYEIIHKKDPAAVQRIKQKDVYEQQKELILLGERVVLTTLGFDFNIHHPYKPLVEAIKKLKVAQNSLAQVAWNFVNDGLRTSLCLQFKPHHIAAGAIFLAAKFLKVKLPSEGEKVWWKEFDVTSRQLEEVSNQMLELYEQNRMPASQGSEAGGRASHQAPAKSNEASISVKGQSQVEGAPAVKPGPLNPSSTWSGSDQAHANYKEAGAHRTNQSRSGDHGSTESKSDISEHRLDDETKEHRHPEQHQLPHMSDKVGEAPDRSRSDSEQRLKDNLERENGRNTTIELEEQKNGSASSKNDRQGAENTDPLSSISDDCMKKLNKEKIKAAREKRKSLRGDVAHKKELMDDDDLIERELEAGVELAVDDEKVKRESKHDHFNPSNSPDLENPSYEKDHKKLGNGNYLETDGHDSGGLHTDSAEDGEMCLLHNGEVLHSPKSISRKRKAESPDRRVEGKQHLDYIPGYRTNHNEDIGDRSRIGKLGYGERDHKRHVQENHV